MKNITYTTQVTKAQLEIRYDDCAESPREWDNLGYFITLERNYNTPDKNPTLERIIKEASEDASNCTEHIANITKLIASEFDEKLAYIVPVSKYEHGGVTYRRGERHGWDEGVAGFYIVTKESAKDIPDVDFDKVIEQELETYTAWANGEVYAFILYDNDGDVIDSCGGFFDIDDIKEYLPEEWKNENLSDYLKY